MIDRELARKYDAEWQRLWETVPVETVCNAFEVYLPVVMRKHTGQQARVERFCKIEHGIQTRFVVLCQCRLEPPSA